ncbi:hypothetical protein WN944_000099 [Citrus x changshan-huyou]|uniref:Uncharacterized protein n=1 Tax=Citrus x changshan-huyou TaxID=2935761 RepID=A0AAP0MEQ3_9ROSI
MHSGDHSDPNFEKICAMHREQPKATTLLLKCQMRKEVFKMMRLNNPTKSFSHFLFFRIPLVILFFLNNTAPSKATTIPVNVGLVLDINGDSNFSFFGYHGSPSTELVIQILIRMATSRYGACYCRTELTNNLH